MCSSFQGLRSSEGQSDRRRSGSLRKLFTMNKRCEAQRAAMPWTLRTALFCSFYLMTPICQGQRLIRVICFSNYRYRTHLPRRTHRPEVPDTQVHTRINTLHRRLYMLGYYWNGKCIQFFSFALICIHLHLQISFCLSSPVSGIESASGSPSQPGVHLSHRVALCNKLYKWYVIIFTVSEVLRVVCTCADLTGLSLIPKV